jgi:hypothetical protein
VDYDELEERVLNRRPARVARIEHK